MFLVLKRGEIVCIDSLSCLFIAGNMQSRICVIISLPDPERLNCHGITSLMDIDFLAGPVDLNGILCFNGRLCFLFKKRLFRTP